MERAGMMDGARRFLPEMDRALVFRQITPAVCERLKERMRANDVGIF
jgi:hypothetical protein